MIEQLRIQVRPDDAGKRADQVVFAYVPTSDRALVRAAFTAGEICLVTLTPDGREEKRSIPKGYKVRDADVIEVTRLYEKKDRRVLPNPDLPLPVIYEDDAMLAFNKRAGLPVHPLRLNETHTLANAMVARYPETAEIGPDPLFPALVHRLDTDTSGVLLAARTESAYAALRHQFRMRQVRKEYCALVLGQPPDRGILEHYLGHDPVRPGHMLARLPLQKKESFRARHSKKQMRWMRAVTEYQVSDRIGKFALLQVTIRTGVTHQIRCQLSAAGFPIVNDVLYGGPCVEGLFAPTRHFLHASAVECHHPFTEVPMRIEAPLPQKWQEAIEHLRNSSE